ncbi:type II toxin-antitoxin system RelB/DinJ family antitoxin [Agrilactobacillus fermenti]|uniref:type II toxin-antitoxin system RelB/DinJ family antitoxin n=1 Tax=Agrilactobacillus fermenti TaxID=2586909 RepID=UPI003A5BC1C2
MATTAKKATGVFTRITPELEAQAEEVLDQLQIPMSTALSMFLQQVVNQGKIPFEIKSPDKTLDFDTLTKEQFDSEIKKGFDDFKNVQTYSSSQL